MAMMRKKKYVIVSTLTHIITSKICLYNNLKTKDMYIVKSRLGGYGLNEISQTYINETFSQHKMDSTQVLYQAKHLLRVYLQEHGAPELAAGAVEIYEMVNLNGYVISYSVQNPHYVGLNGVEYEEVDITSVFDTHYNLRGPQPIRIDVNCNKQLLRTLDTDVDMNVSVPIYGDIFTMDVHEGGVRICGEPIGIPCEEDFNINVPVNPEQVMLMEKTIAGIEISLIDALWYVPF